MCEGKRCNYAVNIQFITLVREEINNLLGIRKALQCTEVRRTFRK